MNKRNGEGWKAAGAVVVLVSVPLLSVTFVAWMLVLARHGFTVAWVPAVLGAAWLWRVAGAFVQSGDPR